MSNTGDQILEILTLLKTKGIKHYVLVTASSEGFTKSVSSLGGVESAILFTATSMAQQELLSVISTNNKGQDFKDAEISNNTAPLN